MVPPAIAKLADMLAGMPGVVAVVLGGSRALGTALEGSDWDLVGTAGQAAKAVLEAAHARICASRTWNLNEKGLVDRAGLSRIQASFAAIPREPEALVTWIDRLRSDLDRES